MGSTRRTATSGWQTSLGRNAKMLNGIVRTSFAMLSTIGRTRGGTRSTRCAMLITFSFLWWFLMHGYLSGFFSGSVVTVELHGSTQRIFGSGMFYLVALTTVALALFVDFQCKGIRCCLSPS